jgi:hypothetical protein
MGKHQTADAKLKIKRVSGFWRCSRGGGCTSLHPVILFNVDFQGRDCVSLYMHERLHVVMLFWKVKGTGYDVLTHYG